MNGNGSNRSRSIVQRFTPDSSKLPARSDLDTSTAIPTQPWLLQGRHREQNSREQEIGEQQRPDDVGGLGDEKRRRGPPALDADQFTKARLETNTSESQTEPDDPKSPPMSPWLH
jgi:hypothetical protein